MASVLLAALIWSAAHLHQNSAITPGHKHHSKEPIQVRVPDEQFLNYLDKTSVQLDTLLAQNDLSKDQIENLTRLQNQITAITQQYSYTSPALVLLGPLGAAAIVLKERKLEQEFLYVLNQLAFILREETTPQITFNTVAQAVDYNTQLINHLLP